MSRRFRDAGSVLSGRGCLAESYLASSASVTGRRVEGTATLRCSGASAEWMTSPGLPALKPTIPSEIFNQMIQLS